MSRSRSLVRMLLRLDSATIPMHPMPRGCHAIGRCLSGAAQRDPPESSASTSGSIDGGFTAMLRKTSESHRALHRGVISQQALSESRNNAERLQFTSSNYSNGTVTSNGVVWDSAAPARENLRSSVRVVSLQNLFGLQACQRTGSNMRVSLRAALACVPLCLLCSLRRCAWRATSAPASPLSCG